MMNKKKNEVESGSPALRVGAVMRRFSIDDRVIIKASLDIRSEFMGRSALAKPEQIDRELRGYLVELLNSLNGA